jgi:hypothetical protein
VVTRSGGADVGFGQADAGSAAAARSDLGYGRFTTRAVRVWGAASVVVGSGVRRSPWWLVLVVVESSSAFGAGSFGRLTGRSGSSLGGEAASDLWRWWW